MKPVMESEMFVANEYVATCYLVKCDDHNEYFTVNSTTGEPNYDSTDSDRDGYVISVVSPYKFYSGLVNGKVGTVWYNPPIGLTDESKRVYGHPISEDYITITESNYESLKTQYTSITFGPNAS